MLSAKVNRVVAPRPNLAGLAGVFLAATFALAQIPPAYAQLYAKPVTTPDKPYQMDGYEILPPRGQGWFEMKRDHYFIYFGKRLSSPTHSFIAVALSAPVSESFDNAESFRDHVSKQLADNPGDARSKVTVMAVDIEPASGPFCVRYQTRAEDRGATNARGKTLLAETFGLSCLHADHKNLAIDVSYTERGLPAETDLLLRGEGESFIRSLKFTPRR